MIATKPDFIKGDNLTLKQYLAVFITNKGLLYSSRWRWWKKTTQFWCIPLLALDLTIFSALLYHQWKAGEGIDWLFIGLIMLLPFLLILPLIWRKTYKDSFINARQITTRIMLTLAHFIPGASKVRRLAHCNYLFMWNDLEFEAAYSLIPTLDSKGRTLRQQKCFLICLHFMPDPSHQSEIVDKKGNLLDEFRDNWEAYCKGKESCKYLRIENYSIYSFIPFCELRDASQLTTTMEQIQYLIKRYNLKPLYLTSYIETEIKHWLALNDQDAPEGIEALNIGIFRSEEGYFLYMSGSKTYDPQDDDWACNDDFVPEEKYLEVPMDATTDTDWLAFQSQVRGILMKEIPQLAQRHKSIYHQCIITMGFDDGNLIKIKDKGDFTETEHEEA